MADARGQAHTLEGVVAALLVLTSVVLALQMTAVTPLTASTANQHVQSQERAAARGVLEATSGASLRRTVRYWDPSQGSLPNAGSGGYYVGTGPTNLEPLRRLNETFAGRGVSYNVRLVYFDGPNGQRRTRRFLYSGAPTVNAVEVTRTVTLYDDDRLVGPGGPTGTTLENASSYVVPDAAPNSTLYNTVTVEVVVWRM